MEPVVKKTPFITIFFRTLLDIVIVVFIWGAVGAYLRRYFWFEDMYQEYSISTRIITFVIIVPIVFWIRKKIKKEIEKNSEIGQLLDSVSKLGIMLLFIMLCAALVILNAMGAFGGN
jgi:hypothetical protein